MLRFLSDDPRDSAYSIDEYWPGGEQMHPNDDRPYDPACTGCLVLDYGEIEVERNFDECCRKWGLDHA